MSCKCQNNYSSYYSLTILVYDSATALPPILELSCNNYYHTIAKNWNENPLWYTNLVEHR